MKSASGALYSPTTDVVFGDDSDQQTLFREVQPDTPFTGQVVFDVPDGVLGQPKELQFNELGFGSTKGFIALPGV